MNIILSYGLNSDEERDAVRSTVASRGSVERAALDYVDANPDASLDEIADAIRECIA